MQDPEICSKCGKAKQLFDTGSFSKWVASCKCAFNDSPNQEFVCLNCCRSATEIGTNESEACNCDTPMYILVQELQEASIKICKSCGKRISNQEGSLTQWIFLQGRCRCDRPEHIVESLDKYIQPGFVGYKERFDELEELEIASSKFPVERFKPLAEIGKGTAGEVYLAGDKLLGKKVAVKVLVDLTPEQLIAFHNEAKATAKLDHPNIIRILDFGSSKEGTPYMVMDYFESVSLEDFLGKNKRLGEDDARAVFRQLANALHYAHQRSIYHRDLKPSNILISETDEGLEARLIDFGVAKVKETTGLTIRYQNRTIAGTPFYMSPDTANGEEFDAQSEIYSLGCVLFEALVGKPPFDGESALEILSQHACKDPPGLEDFTGEFSQDISYIVSRCLEKKKYDRFSSMQELEHALGDVKLNTGSTEATGAKKRLSKFAQALIAVIVLGIIICSVSIFNSVKENTGSSKKEVNLGKSFDSSIVDNVFSETIKDSENFEKESRVARVMDSLEDDSSESVLVARDLTKNRARFLETKPRGAIGMWGCQMDSSTFKSISRVKGLSRLELRDCYFDYNSLSLLSSAPKFNYFRLTDANLEKVTYHHFSAIAKLKHLTVLRFDLSQNAEYPTGNYISPLAALKNLIYLELGYMDLRKDSFESISKLRKLIHLELNDCNFDVYDLGQLKNLRNFQKLGIRGRKLRKHDIALIAQFKSLSQLSLTRCEIESDDVFNELASLPGLKSLDLRGSKMVDQKQGSVNKLKALNRLYLGKSSSGYLRSMKGLELFKLTVEEPVEPEDIVLLKKQNKIDVCKVSGDPDASLGFKRL